SEPDPRRIATALRRAVVGARNAVDLREPQIPPLVQLRRLGVRPARVHRRADQDLDVDAHDRAAIARRIAAAESRRNRAWRRRTMGWPIHASALCARETARIRYVTSPRCGSSDTSNSSSPLSAWFVSVPYANPKASRPSGPPTW